MIIIGELINSTRKAIKKAIEERDEKYIQDIAIKQAENYADYIDVNAGAFIYDEVELLVWLVETVQAVVDKPLALDSPRPEALEAALKVHKGVPIINSISAEKERYNKVLPLVKEYKTKVMGLCMSDEGMPETAEDRLKVAQKLIHDLDSAGVPPDDVYLDPLIKPISVNGAYGLQALDTIAGIASWKSGVHLTCGLSNISFGMPHRYLLNQAFLVMAMYNGLDSALIDPLDKQLIGLIKATEVLLNKDEYGVEYLKAARSGKIGRG